MWDSFATIEIASIGIRNPSTTKLSFMKACVKKGKQVLNFKSKNVGNGHKIYVHKYQVSSKIQNIALLSVLNFEARFYLLEHFQKSTKNYNLTKI